MGTPGSASGLGKRTGRKIDIAPQPDSTTYTDITHALCNAHARRKLTYVVDTAPEQVADLADQAIDALLAVKKLTEPRQATAATADDATVTTQTASTTPDAPTAPDAAAGAGELAAAEHLLRSALVLGKNATAKRATKLERKYNNLFTRMTNRWDDYVRFAHDPAVPFDNNPGEQTIRMPKLRVKVSGSLRSIDGAQDFAAIRSYTATATRAGQNMLDVLVQAATGSPGSPAPPDRPREHPHPAPTHNPRGTSGCPNQTSLRPGPIQLR